MEMKEVRKMEAISFGLSDAGRDSEMETFGAKTPMGRIKIAAGILLFGAAVVMACYSIFLCFSTDIWYDELFTEGLVEQPVSRLLELAAKDVHPPLYYLIVKAGISAIQMFAPGADAIMISKGMSVVPYMGLLVYALWLVRKRFGWLCAGLFSFCLLAMPQMPNYTTEVRMYSWALFFITAAFLHMGEILRGRRRHWLAFFLYGICAAYTHYFAAVAAACLYLALGGLLIWKERSERRTCLMAGSFNKEYQAFYGAGFCKGLAPWLISVVLSVLAYLPWIPSAVAQVSAVREDYWILPLTLSCFGGCVKFVLKPSTGYQWLDYSLAVVLFALLALFLLMAFVRQLRRSGKMRKEGAVSENDKKKEEWFWEVYASCGVWVLVGTALFGIIVSFCMRPIFVYRYMLPALGGFWFCFAYFVSRQKRPLLIFSLAVLIAVGVVDYRAFAGEERYKKAEMERTEQAFSLLEDSVVVFNFDQVQAVAGYYLDQDTWLYMDEPESLIVEMFPHAKGAVDTEWLLGQLEEGNTVWFVGSGLARESILKEWEQQGIVTVEMVDSCLLERYWMNLYRLELE